MRGGKEGSSPSPSPPSSPDLSSLPSSSPKPNRVSRTKSFDNDIFAKQLNSVLSSVPSPPSKSFDPTPPDPDSPSDSPIKTRLKRTLSVGSKQSKQLAPLKSASPPPQDESTAYIRKLYPEERVQEIVKKMTDLEEGIVKERRSRWGSEKYTFTGHSLVTWLEVQHLVHSRDEAMEVGKILMLDNHITPVGSNLPFKGRKKEVYYMKALEEEMKKKKEAMKKKKKEKPKEKVKIFGSSIEAVMELQKEEYPELKVPRVIVVLIDKLKELKCETIEGIFRVPGNTEDINELKEQLDQENYEITNDDPNVVGGCLKLWFRSTAEPLIPQEFYSASIAAAEDRSKCVSIIMSDIPPVNREIIKYLSAFLLEIADPESVKVTKMGVENLAMVFAPGFLRCTDLTMMLVNASHEGSFVNNVILGLAEIED